MDRPTIPIKKNISGGLFTKKRIFIISHENWGRMLLSKHHYAIELATAGNEVYFINHPDKRKVLKRGEIRVFESEYSDVKVVESRLFHPYFFKFKFRRLYHLLTKLHLRRLIKKTGYPDIVWSFDSDNTFSLKSFSKSQLRILMPVDGPFGHRNELDSAEGADVIISVTENILRVFENVPIRKLRISHGVASVFFSDNSVEKRSSIKIGYSGSLLRGDIDTTSLLTIIESNPGMTFEFWGEYDIHKSNIHLPQDVSDDTKGFIEKLKSLPNVKLHGPVSPDELAAGLVKMDVNLICYIEDRQNSHKLLEYLATGQVVVSSHLSTYKDADPDLFVMVNDASNNLDFCKLFKHVVSNLEEYNSPKKRNFRRNYANQFSYLNNIRKIEEFVFCEAD